MPINKNTDNNLQQGKSDNSPLDKGAGGSTQNKTAIPYNKNLLHKSRRLRNESTLSEILLWKEIKDKQLGVLFNRQKPLLEFIVDFYCAELRLVIEVDGSSHDSEEAQAYDKNRQQLIEEHGVTFLRIDDLEVKKDMANVLRQITATIDDLRFSLGQGS